MSIINIEVPDDKNCIILLSTANGTKEDAARIVLDDQQKEAFLNAFTTTFGLTPEEGEDMTPIRNVFYRLRKYAESILMSFNINMAKKAAAQQAKNAVDNTLNQIVIEES